MSGVADLVSGNTVLRFGWRVRRQVRTYRGREIVRWRLERRARVVTGVLEKPRWRTVAFREFQTERGARRVLKQLDRAT